MKEERVEKVPDFYESCSVVIKDSSDVIFEYDLTDESIIFLSDCTSDLYQLPLRLDHGISDLMKRSMIHKDSIQDVIEMFTRMRHGEKEVCSVIKTCTETKDILWGTLTLRAVQNGQKTPEKVVGILKDFTQQREIQIKYKNERLYREVVKRYALIFYEVDLTHKKVLSGLDELMEFMQVPTTNDYDGVLDFLIQQVIYKEDRGLVKEQLSSDTLLKKFEKGIGWVEFDCRRCINGRQPSWIQCGVYLIKDVAEEVVKAFYYMRDINKKKEEVLELKEKAERDFLTGLYNKGVTQQLIEATMEEPLKEGELGAFYIVDLDNFKEINDHFGHAMGDAVLMQVASQLCDNCQRGEIVGRIGGDEFVIYSHDLFSEEDIKEKADLICHTLGKPYDGIFQDLKVSGTVGVAVIPEHGNTFDELYQKADVALYVAKKRGKNTYGIYNEDMHVNQEKVLKTNQTVFDEAYEKMFSENMMEYIFQALYDAKDLEAAVTQILELTSKHYRFCRAYVFELDESRTLFSSTFEWSAKNIAPLMEEHRVIPRERAKDVEAYFEKEDLVILSNNQILGTQKFPGSESDTGVCACFHYAFYDEKGLRGFIGFDQVDPWYEPKKEGLLEFKKVVQILDIFLRERHSRKELEKLCRPQHEFTIEEIKIQGAKAFTKDIVLYNLLSDSTDDYIFMADCKRNLFYIPKEMVDEFALPGLILENAIDTWASRMHPEDVREFLAKINAVFSGAESYHRQEYRVRNKWGKWVWMRCTAKMYFDEDGIPSFFTGFLSNLERRSTVDFLSGLPNKYVFASMIQEKVALSSKRGAVLLIGLDNFKNINNLYGREFGDQVIHESAQKIQALLPVSCKICRLDGDTFGLAFFDDECDLLEQVYGVVSGAFEVHQQLGNQKYYCTISGGFATFEGELVDYHRLLKEAEFALEYSKISGKNRLTIYNETIMAERERTLSLIEYLRDSVEHNFEGFELYFQPQMLAREKEMKNAEALLRWRCKEYGMVSPVEIIPLLEQTGLIHAVGKWVLLRAMDVCMEFRRRIPDFVISVNVSFAQLQDTMFLSYLEDLIKKKRLMPEAIHLELTESCIVAGSSSLAAVFCSLRELGFCIEMDDFGTGYSSLEILKNAPADVVKIDRSFVRNITESDFDATFIQFIVSLCHSVDIKVCVEGVETWEEYEVVNSMGVDLIQGFLFGKPHPKEEFEKLFLNHEFEKE